MNSRLIYIRTIPQTSEIHQSATISDKLTLWRAKVVGKSVDGHTLRPDPWEFFRSCGSSHFKVDAVVFHSKATAVF